ncbi:hypothetical protein YK56LOC_60080 [Caballeronia sp. HLA56]
MREQGNGLVALDEAYDSTKVTRGPRARAIPASKAGGRVPAFRIVKVPDAVSHKRAMAGSRFDGTEVASTDRFDPA